MPADDLVLRIERFERMVATCLCVVPLLFAGQCLAVVLLAPIFEEMFAGFGSKLPVATEWTLHARPLWLLMALGLPAAALVFSRRGKPTSAVMFSTVSGLVLFLVAQFLTVSLFLPIFALADVARPR